MQFPLILLAPALLLVAGMASAAALPAGNPSIALLKRKDGRVFSDPKVKPKPGQHYVGSVLKGPKVKPHSRPRSAPKHPRVNPQSGTPPKRPRIPPTSGQNVVSDTPKVVKPTTNLPNVVPIPGLSQDSVNIVGGPQA